MKKRLKLILDRLLKRGYVEAQNNSRVARRSSIDAVTFEGENFVACNSSLAHTKLGFHSYCGVNVQIMKATIGRFCSIGPNTKIGLGIHPTDMVSTHPAFYSNNKPFSTFADQVYIEEYKEVEIGHDVWLAGDVSVVGGVKIGTGVVVAAGSVVTKDLEPYGIYGGVPAKLIRYRFDQQVRHDLLESKWWEKSVDEIRDKWRDFMDVQLFLSKDDDGEA